MNCYDLSPEEEARELRRVLGQAFELLDLDGDDHAGRLVHAVVQLHGRPRRRPGQPRRG